VKADRYHIDTEACPECGDPDERFVVDYLGVWVGRDGRRRVVVRCINCDAAWSEIIMSVEESAIGIWQFGPPDMRKVATHD
jgi:hypothetical protein